MSVYAVGQVYRLVYAFWRVSNSQDERWKTVNDANVFKQLMSPRRSWIFSSFLFVPLEKYIHVYVFTSLFTVRVQQENVFHKMSGME